MKMPIYDHRTVVGFARSLDHAAKVIRRTIHVDRRARLHVWKRNASLVDLPPGFVFSIVWGPV
jgi:hypothetical protein